MFLEFFVKTTSKFAQKFSALRKWNSQRLPDGGIPETSARSWPFGFCQCVFWDFCGCWMLKNNNRKGSCRCCCCCCCCCCFSRPYSHNRLAATNAIHLLVFGYHENVRNIKLYSMFITKQKNKRMPSFLVFHLPLSWQKSRNLEPICFTPGS